MFCRKVALLIFFMFFVFLNAVADEDKTKINNSNNDKQVQDKYMKVGTPVNISGKQTGNISSALSNKSAKEEARKINNIVRSTSYQQKVSEYKKYFLDDKKLHLKKYMGKYANRVSEIEKNNFKKIIHNKYLKYNERLIVAISSSVPKETLFNYFDSLSNVNSDVVFVVNGLINNNPKYIKPTLQYISELLSSRRAGVPAKKGKYLLEVDINPKIFMKYSITKAPAVIFVKNYNFYDEMQGHNYDGKNENENVYIAYGDSEITYVLEKINKEAKSEGLKRLILAIRGKK